MYLPGRKGGDIDAVLVGPPGVWALEVKAWAGAYRNVGDRWEVRDAKGWKQFRKNPSQQARKNAGRLGSFFEADGVRQWVTPAVIWADPESSVAVENPVVAVWAIDRLPEERGNIWQGKEMSRETRERIIEKLARLCQREREKAAQSPQ